MGGVAIGTIVAPAVWRARWADSRAAEDCVVRGSLSLVLWTSGGGKGARRSTSGAPLGQRTLVRCWKRPVRCDDVVSLDIPLSDLNLMKIVIRVDSVLE